MSLVDSSPGHSSPISKLSTVPDTAPIANSTAETFAHRQASSSATGSSRRIPRRCITKMIAGKATPKHARMMCQPSGSAICWRAGINPAGSAAEAARDCTVWTSSGLSTPLP